MKMSRKFGCRFVLSMGVLTLCVAQISIARVKDSQPLVSPDAFQSALKKTNDGVRLFYREEFRVHNTP